MTAAWERDDEPSEWRRWVMQWMAEQRLIDQIRAREQDPRAFVRITGV